MGVLEGRSLPSPPPTPPTLGCAPKSPGISQPGAENPTFRASVPPCFSLNFSCLSIFCGLCKPTNQLQHICGSYHWNYSLGISQTYMCPRVKQLAKHFSILWPSATNSNLIVYLCAVTAVSLSLQMHRIPEEMVEILLNVIAVYII